MKYVVGSLAGVAAVSACLLAPAAAREVPAKLPAIDKYDHKTYEETIPGTKVKFTMVAIPGGTYMMGSPTTEKGRGGDELAHPVTVKGMWVGKFEVTWDEFDTYWRAKPGRKEDKEPEKPKDADAVTRPTPAYADETFGLGREGNPVISISYHTCMQYCRWLSIKTGKNYRLPTEAEWEWACRAGTTTAYHFGDDPSKLGDYAWTSGNSDGKPQPVGKKKPNPWGLYDTYGNVIEWCIDHYDKDFYATCVKEKLTLQPVVKPTNTRFSHVQRGGSWDDEPANLFRSAARRGSTKDLMKLDPQRPQSIWWLTSGEHVGFRIVRPITEQKDLEGVRSLITRESK